MRSREEIQNSIDNLTKTIQFLSHERYVLLFEVGEEAVDTIDELIDMVYFRIAELNANLILDFKE